MWSVVTPNPSAVFGGLCRWLAEGRENVAGAGKGGWVANMGLNATDECETNME